LTCINIRPAEFGENFLKRHIRPRKRRRGLLGTMEPIRGTPGLYGRAA
jgi:hypothetical protein